MPGTGTLHNSHTCAACLKWRSYRSENAWFELNLVFFSLGFEVQANFLRQSSHDSVTRALDCAVGYAVWRRFDYLASPHLRWPVTATRYLRVFALQFIAPESSFKQRLRIVKASVRQTGRNKLGSIREAAKQLASFFRHSDRVSDAGGHA